MFSTTDSRFDRKSFLPSLFPGTILAFLYFLFLLPWLAKNRLLGLDESMYADMAWSEVKDGHWWPLVFHGQSFWDKPPLYFWLQGLAIKVLGKNEFAIRIWSSLASAFSVYFVSRLGLVLGNSARVGFFCALMLVLQEHFVLYSRIGTLDMTLLACLLGTWWHMTKAFNPPSLEEADKDLLKAGIWMALGVAVKSWFGFVLVPGLFLALLLCRPWPFSPNRVLVRLFLPAVVVMIVWMTASFLTFGMPYLQWAWGFDLVTRFNSGGWSSASNFQYHWQFYAVIAQQGMAFLWPLIPLSFLLWLREGAHEFWRGRFDATSVIGSSFLVYYLVFILFLIATLINYSLPLTPLAVLSLAFLFRFVEESRVVLAATVALLLAILNGLTGDLYLPWTVVGSFVCGLFLVLPSNWGLPRVWMNLALVAWGLTMGYQTARYWINPPDPNRVWVAAVVGHPAAYPGQNLYFVGEETDARVLEFYSDYHVCPLLELPPQPPKDGPLLFRDNDRAVYFPPPPPEPEENTAVSRHKSHSRKSHTRR